MIQATKHFPLPGAYKWTPDDKTIESPHANLRFAVAPSMAEARHSPVTGAVLGWGLRLAFEACKDLWAGSTHANWEHNVSCFRSF